MGSIENTRIRSEPKNCQQIMLDDLFALYIQYLKYLSFFGM